MSKNLSPQVTSFKKKFEEAMDDDFNTAQVLGNCFDLVREINKFLDSSPGEAGLVEAQKSAQECFALLQKALGLFCEDPVHFLEARKRGALKYLSLSDDEIQNKIVERKEARADKNFKLADKIRDDLAAQGIILKDNPDGTTTWTVK